MADVISRAQLAREFGVSKMAATKWVRRGLPVRQDGLLNHGEAVRWVRENCLIFRGGVAVRESRGGRMPTEAEWDEIGRAVGEFLKLDPPEI